MRSLLVLWARPVLAILVCIAAVLTTGTREPLSAQSDDPSTLPRLAFSDLRYLGGFRLPAESSNGDTFSFGGKQLTYNPVNNSLFVGSRRGNVAEVSIPSPVNASNVNAMPFATYLQSFFDPTEGRLSQVATSGVNLDGLLVYDNKLYGTASIFYDANNTQRVSHYARSLQLGERSFEGWSQVWETGRTGFVSGMMAVIPDEWRERLGGVAATGQCCIPIVTRTSWGPAAFAFDPTQIGQPTVGATPLVYYTDDHATLGAWSGSNPTYGATIAMGGMAIVAGTRTALFFGRNGLGEHCYGNGTNNQALHETMGADGSHWCYDPTSSDKGSHAYPYRYQIWAYDLNDFADVRSGAKQPWEVVPYGVWPFEVPTPEAGVRIGGVGYDPVTQTVYLSQLSADQDGYSYRPAIHVLKINASPATASPGEDSSRRAPSSGSMTGVSLTANRNAPQSPGTAITFTAAAQGGADPHEYKWLVDSGAGFKPVTGWSQLDTFVWTPGVANANYRVGVWARSGGSRKDEGEATFSVSFPIGTQQPAPIRSVNLVPDKPAPQMQGTAVKWTAQVNGGAAQYKWLVHDGGSWSAVTGWTTQNTFTWTPAVANPNYHVGVWVRHSASRRDEADATSSAAYPIRSNTEPVARLSHVSITTDRSAPQQIGTTVVATASVVGGATPHTFRWLINDGTGWKPVTAWTTSNTFAWTPAKAEAYWIGVWVRSAGNISEQYEVSHSVPFPIR